MAGASGLRPALTLTLSHRERGQHRLLSRQRERGQRDSLSLFSLSRLWERVGMRVTLIPQRALPASPSRRCCKNLRTAGSASNPIANAYAASASATAPMRASKPARAAQYG